MVWGGPNIARLKGLDESLYAHVGESWELSGVPGQVSTVARGAFAGQRLDELIALHREQLVGRACWERFGTFFPVLVKLIDTTQDLSVQVHPDDRVAARYGIRGKNEMWYVVHADAGSRLLCGWNVEMSPQAFRRHVQEETILSVVRSYEVGSGDIFYLPAGRIHALGRGLRVVEIQDTSDVTYRIYDYGRPGLDGQPRELHIDKAEEALDYTLHSDYRLRYSARPDMPCPVVEAPNFSIRLLALRHPVALDYAGCDAFVVFVCVGGKCEIRDGAGHVEEAEVGTTVLLPATTAGVTLSPLTDDTTVLEVTPTLRL